MTSILHTFDSSDMTALPDPHHQPEFYAAVPTKRLIAWIVDTAIVFAICLLISLLTLFAGLFIWVALWLVVGFAYRVVTISRGSATWGMRLCAIELRDSRGERLDSGQALMHTLGYSVSVAIPVIQVASIVLMLITERKQGVTDLILGTVMLNRRM